MIKTVWLFFLILSFQSLSLAGSDCTAVYAHRTLGLKLNSRAIQFAESSGYTYKLLKLDELDRNSLEYKEAQYYLDKIFMLNLVRLNKSDPFKEMIKNTNESVIAKQSYMMLMFEINNPRRIVAGAAFVLAKDANQQLALQKELAMDASTNLDGHYPRVEVARVGVDPDAPNASQNFRVLIDSIMDVVTESHDIASFYAFTSVVHKKFYKHFGYDSEALFDSKSLPQLPEKDVILKIKVPGR